MDSSNTASMSRRGFLKSAAVLGGSMVIGFNAGGALAITTGSAPADSVGFNPFVKIAPDGTVTVVVKHFEMGQGTSTGLTTLVAEELNVAWDQVAVEFSPSNKNYINLAFGGQGTGGSTAMANSYLQYRQAGAAARDMLVRAAAAEWNVDATEVVLKDGQLASGNNKGSIGDFIQQAAKLEPAAEPVLKDAASFTLIGKDKLPRKDSMAKTTGKAMFAMDVKVPNMVYVTILRSPLFGGTLKSFEIGAAAEVNGFVDAKALPDNSGVAIYADSTWASIKARRSVTAEWDNSAADSRGAAEMLSEYTEKLNGKPTYDVTGKADLVEMETAAKAASRSLSVDFHFPLLAHAPMEPLNCVIEPTEDGGVRVHDGCQFPMITHPTVAAITQLPEDKVEIITYYAGGSFGRRANTKSDYHAQAAMAFVALGGKKAIKLVWTREDDLAGGFYRPMFAQRAHIGIGDDDKVSAWSQHTVAQSIFKGGPMESFVVHDGIDHASVEGIADTAYQLPMALGLTDYESPMPVLWWRSVGHSQSGYTMEVLMDMAAEAAGKDPVEFRLSHLDQTDENQGRLAGVLQLAADKAGWDGKQVAGKGRGIAVHKSFDTYVAQVMDVSVNAEGAISIDKVVCAVDCGVAVNPDVIRAQMEGAIGYGLGAVMRNQITMKDGVVEQGNFPQYEPLRITDMPVVEVHIVASDKAPSGVGEPGLPPAGPALANAIYAAIGTRVTSLPMTSAGIKFA
ncbi:xanthine dehydrogenase family protein molybdopterin-binding subunit [Granulosicoccus antarcticus]|uniref:Isoquinoline 1-oxidoreductase subunit beta n=1 Tax=Granulosicoccus antarcticus IMCC3135 TaxID=1192854 RepID=A0A2Z2P795_9GAMM|nr:xanthine dehydrogenase family protein molybdopterin-binding subunit [Granulosicoccus antarcticus]ASJ75724.1 Isoquinoline 1-oxidoreductase subunit beta [Granulosicoccus antarcticus IMCC3135]